MRARLLALTFALVIQAGCAKIVVVHVVPPSSAEGVIYALPKTVARLQIKIDKTKVINAPYVEFAAVFAPDGKPACKGQCTAQELVPAYSIQEGTTFATYGEPDPAHVYLVKFVGRGAIDQSLSMTWNETGLLSAASASVTNRTADVVLSGLKLAAGLGTKAAFGATEALKKNNVCGNTSEPADAADQIVIPILNIVAAPYQNELIDNYCSLPTADRTQISSNAAKLHSASNAFQDRIVPLLKERDNVLSGVRDTSEPATLVGLQETRISLQLTKLYLGSKQTKTWDGTLDVRELTLAATGTVVLHLDPVKGVCLGKSEIPPTGKPFPEEFVVLSSTPCENAPPVSLVLACYPGAQLYSEVTEDSDSKGDRSFRYRVPAQVKASLVGANKHSYGDGVFSVAQLGKVLSLPANRNSKNLSYDLAFVESTGALKTFKLGTIGGLDAATVDALSGVGGTILDATNKQKQNEDEVTVLTREDAILKLKDDICNIQKKYGLPCTVQP